MSDPEQSVTDRLRNQIKDTEVFNLALKNTMWRKGISLSDSDAAEILKRLERLERLERLLVEVPNFLRFGVSGDDTAYDWEDEIRWHADEIEKELA